MQRILRWTRIATLNILTIYAFQIEQGYKVALASSGIASPSNVETRSLEIESLTDFCYNLQPVYTLKGHLSEISSMAIDAEGKTLVSGGEDSTVKVWNLQSGKLIQDLQNPWVRVSKVEISADGNIVVASNQPGRRSNNRNSEIRIWDSITGKLKQSFIPEGEAKDFTISPDGRYLVVKVTRNNLSSEPSQYEYRENEVGIVWDLNTGQRIQTSSLDELPAWSRNVSKDDELITLDEGYASYQNPEAYEKDCHFPVRQSSLGEPLPIEINQSNNLLAIATIYNKISIIRIGDTCEPKENLSESLSANQLYLLGLQDLKRHWIISAQRHLDQSLEFYRANCDYEGIAKTIYQISRAHTASSSIHRTENARKSYKLSLSALRQVQQANKSNDEIMLFTSNALYNLALLENERNSRYLSSNPSRNLPQEDNIQPQEIIQMIEESLNICVQTGDTSCQIERLVFLGSLYNSLGDQQIAQQYFREALYLARANGSISIFRDSLIRNEEHDRALAIYRQERDLTGEAETLQLIGENYANKHQMTSEALKFYRSSLEKYREAEDSLKEADVLIDLGFTSWLNARGSEEAINLLDYLLPALEIYREKGDKKREARALQLLGKYYQLSAIPEDGAIIADKEFQRQQYRQAVSSFKLALNIYADASDALKEGETLVELGKLYFQLGEYNNSLNAYEAAKAKLADKTDMLTKVDLLSSTSLANRFLGNYDEALNSYYQALNLCLSMNSTCEDERYPYYTLQYPSTHYDYIGQSHRFSLRDISNNIGEIHFENGDYEQAVASFKLAVATDSYYYFNVISLANLGLTYSQLKDFNLALSFFDHSLDAACSAGAQRIDGTIKGEFSALMELPDEDERFTQCRTAQGIALAEKAWIYAQTEQYNNALDNYQQALSTFEEIGAAILQARVLNNIGITNKNVGRHDSALEFYKRSLSIYQDEEHLLGEAQSLNNIGEIYKIQGLYFQSLNHYRQSLAIFKSLKNDFGLSSVLHNLGGLHDELGQYSEAIDFYEQAISVRQRLGDYSGIGQTLNNVALLYVEKGNEDHAQELYLEAMSAYHQVNDSSGEASVLNNLGLLYIRRGQLEKASEALHKAVDVVRGLGDKAREGNFLDSLGTLYTSLGQYDEALRIYQKALSLVETTDSRAVERITLANIGALFAKQGESEIAILFYKASVNLTEDIRKDLRSLSLEQQKSYAETVADTYRTLADLLLIRGEILEAQQVLELLKVQELQDFTRSRVTNLETRDYELDPAEKTVIDAHSSLVAFGLKRSECDASPDCSDDTLDDLDTQYEQLSAAYNQAVSQLTTQRRAEQEARRARADGQLLQARQELSPEGFAGTAGVLTRNHPGTVLVYPVVLDDKLWVLWGSAGGVVSAIEVPVGRQRIGDAVLRFRQLMTACERGGCDARDVPAVQAVAQELYQYLIPAPLEEELQVLQATLPEGQVPNLVIVPDLVTRYIPFAALHDGQQYLIEKYAISTLLGAEQTTADNPLTTLDSTSILGLGLSNAVPEYGFPFPLENVPEELAAIVQTSATEPGIFRGEAFLNDDFDLDKLRLARRHQIMHLATHGVFDPKADSLSFLMLGAGQPLYIRDLQTAQDYFQNLSLVVLSACETALSDIDQSGLELASIASTFLQARVDTVVASLWQVSDSATSDLMQQFYSSLAQSTPEQRVSVGQALRQAQLAMLYGNEAADTTSRATIAIETTGTVVGANDLPRTAHPYYWSPFTIIGNGL